MRPVGARTSNAGPEIGTKLKALDASDIDGKLVQVVADGFSRMLVFVAPSCPSCDGLMPGVRTLAKAQRNRMSVMLLTGMEDMDANREFIRRHKVGNIPFVVSRDVVDTVGVMNAPYAIVLDRDSVVRAKGTVNHLEHLESLVEALERGHATIESYLAVVDRSVSHG
jgi:methylamine dehydrogenase accessory protein MauD